MSAGNAGIFMPFVLALGYATLLILLLGAAGQIYKKFKSRRHLDITDQWVVVTGCDSGIGQGAVRALAKDGAKVVACCYTETGANAALAAGATWAPHFDLRDDDALRDVAEQILAQSGGALWCVVHAAGTVLPGFIDYQPIKFYRDVMAVNFFAPVLLTQKLLTALRRCRGRVIVVSSVDGIVSLPGNAPYDASKFAIEAYADALRTELSLCGVGVSVINPATMRTPMADAFFPGHRKTWTAMAAEEPEGDWQALWPESWLDQYVEKNTQQLRSIAEDPAAAVNDIVHAATAAHPKLRYLSGRLAKSLFYALWLMPESWSLRIKRLTVQPKPPRSSS
jgi:NAD(P)-dependent dehydrogenase (short-subunit alcohol dehydrogenase family)